MVSTGVTSTYRQLCIKSYGRISIYVRLLQSGCHMHLLNNKNGVAMKLVFICKSIKMKERTCWTILSLRNMGQGLWTWVKAPVSWIDIWRITAKTEISSDSISCKGNGNFGLWCPGSDFVSFVPHGETVNAQYYAAYLQNHLRRAVRRKRPQLQNVIFCMIMLLHIRSFVSGICYDAGGMFIF